MESLKHESTFRINLDDLDYMGVVGHAQWLLILQRSRIELLEALGLSLEALTESGVTAVVRSVSIEFLAPAKHRDLVRVSVEGVESTGASLLLRYLASGSRGNHFVQCDLKLVFVNLAGRPVRVPEVIRTALGPGRTGPAPTRDPQ
ncbi:MAG: acyl-CoA thioesterase [Verrucomicrobiia bacterium]